MHLQTRRTIHHMIYLARSCVISCHLAGLMDNGEAPGEEPLGKVSEQHSVDYVGPRMGSLIDEQYHTILSSNTINLNLKKNAMCPRFAMSSLVRKSTLQFSSSVFTGFLTTISPPAKYLRFAMVWFECSWHRRVRCSTGQKLGRWRLLQLWTDHSGNPTWQGTPWFLVFVNCLITIDQPFWP